MQIGASSTDTTPVLSVVMPCYNEIDTIDAIVKRVLDSPYTDELIVVDDGSTDGTREWLADLDNERVKVSLQPENRGKGAAVRTGFELVSAPFVIIQDADLEYDPADYAIMLGPLQSGDADVVYGSRFQSGRPRRVHLYWHSVGNRLLTTLSNMFTNLNLTDMETCYKAFRLEVVRDLKITEERFGLEPEITARVAAGGWRVWEVGISYAGRSYAQGKKIGWRDGVRALVCIIKYSIVARSERCLERLHESFDDNPDVTVDFLDLASPLPEENGLRPDQFGSVVMVNVLEHLEDHVAALERLATVTRPGGTVIVFVPAFEFLYGRFDRLIGHQRRYRRRTLEATFREAGLDVVDSRYVNLPGWFAWLLTVRLLRILPSGGPLVKLYDRFLIPPIRFVERRVRPPFGQSVLGIARVPAER